MNYIINKNLLVSAIMDTLETNEAPGEILELVKEEGVVEPLYNPSFNTTKAFDLSAAVLIHQLQLRQVITEGTPYAYTDLINDVRKLIDEMARCSTHPFTAHGFIKVSRMPVWSDYFWLLEQREQKKT